MLNKPADTFSSTLGQAFGEVVRWYIDYQGNHVHACVALTNTGEHSDLPVPHIAYVEHADGLRQILATITPVLEKTSRQAAKVEVNTQWETVWSDIRHPVFLTTPTKNRGFGNKRYSLLQAQQEFLAHAGSHHKGTKVHFVRSGPGRIVVRRDVPGGGWEPYGLIMDDKVIRLGKLNATESGAGAMFGVDIFG